MDNKMKEQDYELLSQYLDNELPTPATQALRKRLLAEPQLRATYEQMRTVDNAVRDTFEQPDLERVPTEVVNLLENAPTSPARQASHKRAAWGFAVAASLVVGTGLLVNPDWREQGTIEPNGSDALLANLLESTTSHGQGWDSLQDGRQARPMLSFHSKDGEWCREYLLNTAGNTWRGVACRDGGDWNTRVLSPEQMMDSGNEYRPAGAGSADQVESFINSYAADIPLSLSQEAELIARQWQ